jgi:hypothetical protein
VLQKAELSADAEFFENGVIGNFICLPADYGQVTDNEFSGRRQGSLSFWSISAAKFRKCSAVLAGRSRQTPRHTSGT